MCEQHYLPCFCIKLRGTIPLQMLICSMLKASVTDLISIFLLMLQSYLFEMTVMHNTT